MAQSPRPKGQKGDQVNLNGQVETFADLYNLFLDRAINTLRLKPNTITLYGQTVKKFCAWADGQGITPGELASRDVLAYVNGLRREDGKPYAVKSLRAHTRDLKTMLTFAYEYEYVPRKIKVETPKLPEVKIEYLSDEDQARLIDYVEAQGETKPREAAIVHLLLDTGLRSSEFIGLTWSQISWDAERHTGTIKDVLGKGDKYRDVYFGPRSWHYLQALKREFAGEVHDLGTGTILVNAKLGGKICYIPNPPCGIACARFVTSWGTAAWL